MTRGKQADETKIMHDRHTDLPFKKCYTARVTPSSHERHTVMTVKKKRIDGAQRLRFNQKTSIERKPT